MTAQHKYRAFISYSHRDKDWADWLHRALESYRIPKALVDTEGPLGPVPARLYPIYRDRAESPASSDLQAYIQLALEGSENLIVICSPNARRSKWVDQEILAFKRLGREKRIFAVVVGGEPHLSDVEGEESPNECFPRALLYRLNPDGLLSRERIEPAAADAREEGDGKENAKLKLIAGLIGKEFDALKRRDLEAARRRTRLYGVIAASMGVLALLATVAGIFAYIYAIRSQQAAQTADRTTDFMVDLFSVSDPEESRGETITAREMLDRGVTRLQSELNGEDVVRANLLGAMGRAYTGLGLYPRANELLQEAVTAAQRGGAQDAHLKALLALASNTYADGRYARASGLYQNALNEAHAGGDLAKVAGALLGLGDSASGLNQSSEAEHYYRQALAIDLKLYGERDAATAKALNALGVQFYFDFRFDEARALFQRALATRLALFGPRHVDVAESLNNLASLEYDSAHYAQAEAIWVKALPTYIAIYGDDHPEDETLLNNIGRVQLIRGEMGLARASLERALAIDRKRRAADDEALIFPLNSLAVIATEEEDFAKSQTLLDEALHIATVHRHWMVNQVLGNLADLKERTGDLSGAQAMLTKARGALLEHYGAQLNTAEAWRSAVLDLVTGAIALDQNKLDEAARTLGNADVLLRRRFGDNGLFIHRAEALLLKLARSRKSREDSRRYERLLAQNPLKM